MVVLKGLLAARRFHDPVASAARGRDDARMTPSDYIVGV